MKYKVLFNPLSGNSRGKENADKLAALMPGDELEFVDLTAVTDYGAWFAALGADEGVILCGGDGTLNRFANDTENVDLPENLLYFGTGTGNDFLHDLGHAAGDAPVPVARYLKGLPKVTVNGVTRRFLNGIGYGIDGYCCEVGDELRKTPDKKINYTSIAIKGLLFHFKPVNARVTVDGTHAGFHKVWLAPTMFGRYYGGGMMPTPAQDRNAVPKQVSTMVLYGSGKLHTLMIFPGIFKGAHVKHEKNVRILTGREVCVEFNRPTALQIDGETVLGVTKYTVSVD